MIVRELACLGILLRGVGCRDARDHNVYSSGSDTKQQNGNFFLLGSHCTSAAFARGDMLTEPDFLRFAHQRATRYLVVTPVSRFHTDHRRCERCSDEESHAQVYHQSAASFYQATRSSLSRSRHNPDSRIGSLAQADLLGSRTSPIQVARLQAVFQAVHSRDCTYMEATVSIDCNAWSLDKSYQ